MKRSRFYFDYRETSEKFRKWEKGVIVFSARAKVCFWIYTRGPRGIPNKWATRWRCCESVLARRYSRYLPGLRDVTNTWDSPWSSWVTCSGWTWAQLKCESEQEPHAPKPIQNVASPPSDRSSPNRNWAHVLIPQRNAVTAGQLLPGGNNEVSLYQKHWPTLERDVVTHGHSEKFAMQISR